jgi:CheY-like chemotaxis protein
MQRSESSHWRTSEVARLLALVESERRYYQDLFASLPVAVAVVAEDQSLLTVNREFRVRFGLTGEDLSRVRLADLLPDPKLEQALAQLFMGERRQSAIAIRLGPRQLRVVMQYTQGWHDLAESEVLMTVEEIPESQDTELAMPEVSGPVFWSIDRETERLTCLSADAEQDFGLPPEAWQSLPDWAGTRIHPEDRAMLLDFYRRRDETWQASIDYRLIDSEAKPRHCRDTAAADADVIRVMTMDRTDDVRTARKARLRARIETSGKLSARLAHAANNLLMIVGGYSAEIMDSLPAEDARRSDLQEILNATDRLGKLTAQLNPMPPESVAAIRGRFELAGWAARQAAETSGAPSFILLAEAEVTGLADSVRRAAGGIRVSVKSRPELGEVELRFEFEGRTEAYAEGLLDPFAGPKTGSDPAFGPMKQLRRLIEAGCDAWVEDCPNGARLVLVAPAEASGEEAPQPVVADAALGSVLLVEDEEGLRALLAKALRRRGCEVIEVRSAEEALFALDQRRSAVDMLVTDLTLPGMGGGKLALEVRYLHPETAVVFMTGASEDAEAAGMLNSDAGVSLMGKPFVVDDFVQRVEQILRRPKARGASAD